MKRAIFAVCLWSVLALTGCGKQEVPAVPSETEIVVEIPNALRVFVEMDRSEFLALSTEEFASLVTEALPNYRVRYGIPDGVEMNSTEWEKLRSIMLVEIYGSLGEQQGTDIPSEAEEFAKYVGADVEDPNWIYEAPSSDLIEPMSTEEFRKYLVGLYAYENPGATDTQEFADKLKSVTDDDIKAMKDEFLVMIDKTVE